MAWAYIDSASIYRKEWHRDWYEVLNGDYLIKCRPVWFLIGSEGNPYPASSSIVMISITVRSNSRSSRCCKHSGCWQWGWKMRVFIWLYLPCRKFDEAIRGWISSQASPQLIYQVPILIFYMHACNQDTILHSWLVYSIYPTDPFFEHWALNLWVVSFF